MVKEKRSKAKKLAVIMLIVSALIITVALIGLMICNFRASEMEKESYERMSSGVSSDVVTICFDCFPTAWYFKCLVVFRLLTLASCIVSLIGIVLSAIAVKIKSKKAKIILGFNIIILIIGAFFFVL